MPQREYRCAECAGTFTHEWRGRPRVCCEDCAPIRKRRQIAEWHARQTPTQRRDAYERNREAVIARAATWNKANPERRSQITRKSYQNHRDAKLAYGKRWRAENPGKTYAYSVRYSALRRGGTDDGALSADYAAALRRDPCGYCGKPAVSEIDHIDPASTGGSNHWTNLTASCRSCNPSKSDNTLLIYLLRKG